MDDALLLTVARDLYAEPLTAFTAARNERSRALKDSGRLEEARAVGGFKKPSAAGDAVNRLIGLDDALADDIADLGPRLRAAQATADAAGLRELDRERRALVGRARAAAEGHVPGATAATLNDVEQTVWAALVDARAAAVVRAGVLVRALSPGGFGEVDTDGASAVPVEAAPEDVPVRRRARPAGTSVGEPTRKVAPTPDPRAVQAAEAALSAAQEQAGAAQSDLEGASRAADEAAERHGELEDERDDLRARLTEVEQALRDAKADIAAGRTALRHAERRRRDTAAEVARAVEALDRLG